jgi:hypothetical protein
LVLYGITGFAVTVSFLNESQPAYAIFYGMYVVQTCIPPLIPTGKFDRTDGLLRRGKPSLTNALLALHHYRAVFLVSVGISAERLLWKRIACADNREILVTGKVSMAFFDKTGTLVSFDMPWLVSVHEHAQLISVTDQAGT